MSTLSGVCGDIITQDPTVQIIVYQVKFQAGYCANKVAWTVCLVVLLSIRDSNFEGLEETRERRKNVEQSSDVAEEVIGIRDDVAYLERDGKHSFNDDPFNVLVSFVKNAINNNFF
eukprot:14650087-Ditylum_brightwellii.AAC.1